MVPILFLAIGIINVGLQSLHVSGGDSAEYATVARTWGISHPPGYPLYSLVINILERIIPWGTTPWKIAFASSVPALLTAYFIYKILRLVKVKTFFSLASALLYLFLFPVWQYSLIPEVFSLHTFLTVSITYLLLCFLAENKKRYLLLSAFLCGLCISHHQIFVLFLPGWIYLLKDKYKKIWQDSRIIIQAALLIIAGASFYLYAIIVSLNNTILDWENAKTINGFFRLISRALYGSFKAYSGSGANIVNQLMDIFSGLVFVFLDFRLLGVLFIIIGALVCARYHKRLSLFLSITFSLHIVFLFYTNFVLTSTVTQAMFERFLIPIYSILILFLGIGIDVSYKEYSRRTHTLLRNPRLRTVAAFSFFLFVAAYVLLIAKQNFLIIRTISGERVFEKLGEDVIATIPKGGTLSTQGDTITFVTYYQLYGLKRRSDIALFQLGLMGKENFIEMIKKRAPNLALSSPIKNIEDFDRFVEANKKRGYFSDHEMGNGVWVPYGLLWKYYTDAHSVLLDKENLLAQNRHLWERVYKIPSLTKEDKNIFHLNSVREHYLRSYQNYAKLLVSMEKYTEAEKVLKRLTQQYAPNDLHSVIVYMNMLVYQKKCDEAKTIAKKIDFNKTVRVYPGFAQSAILFLEACDPHNLDINTFRKIMQKNDSEVKTDLDAF